MQIDGPANIPAEEDGSTIDLDALRAEVSKWQERVPKLAKALRERTEELAAAREELRTAQTSPAPENAPTEDTDARLQARNALIAELQEKVTQLGEKHRQLSGTLHTTNLDLESAREDAQNWHTKWQEVTASLDDSVVVASRSSSELEQARLAWSQEKEALAEAHAHAMQQLQRETESLRVRNANLGETVEFANKQIESLGEDMQLLMDRGKSAEVTIAQSQEAQAQLQNQIEALDAQNITLQTQLKDRQVLLDDAQQALQQRDEEALQAAQIVQAQLEEAQASLAETEAHYRSAMQAANEEQTQLVNQLDKKDAQINSLKQQLDEGIALAQKQRKDHQELEVNLQALQHQLEQANADFEGQLAAKETALSETQTALSETQTALSETQTALSELQTALSETQTALSESRAAQDASDEAHEAQLEQSKSDAVELAKLREDQARWVAIEQDLLEQVNAVAEAGDSKQKELDAEIERLSECVSQAQDSHAEREAERRQLTTRLEELADENDKLKSSLEERSALVRELENEPEVQRQNQQSSASTFAAKEQRRTELEHKVTTFQEHAQNLEAKLLTQQGLMSELEGELSEARSENSQSLKAAENKYRKEKEERATLTEKLTALQHRIDDLEGLNQDLVVAEESHKKAIRETEDELNRERAARRDQQNAVYNLQAELEQLQDAALTRPSKEQEKPGKTATQQTKELEQLLRERTEELDKLRWKLEQPVENDDKLVMILNQQLDDARQENKRLREKAAAASAGEELTRIKGIGEKLAQQLQEFGVTTVAQIAAINVTALENENHPLHALQSRIVRDEWIEQAKDLLK
jgi:epidermal growth factor receptor substrate 15